MNKLTGKILYKLGFKYKVSSGIEGETTYGYGKLSSCGYWQFPIYFKNEKPN